MKNIRDPLRVLILLASIQEHYVFPFCVARKATQEEGNTFHAFTDTFIRVIFSNMQTSTLCNKYRVRLEERMDQ